MRTFLGLPSDLPEGSPSVVALGAFDGIHLAHQKILDTAVERARALGVRSLVTTFDPHPLEVLRPGQAPPPIATLAERLELIAARGVEETLVITFTDEFSRIEPAVFVRDVLLGILRAREVVVGFNHTFGRNARGNAEMLQALAVSLGFTTRVIQPLVVDGVVVSSSAIRDALRAGDLPAARRLLGRPYTVRGAVVRGAGRGRRLGFPTANVKPESPLLVPTGVYAGYAHIELEPTSVRPGAPLAPARMEGPHKAVVNVGYRPTFGESEYWVEAYLMDFEGDLYDRTIRMGLTERIREERKFPDVDALRAQVRLDIATAARSL
jgi:riboflavin kinase/FMN adenylyltransferase